GAWRRLTYRELADQALRAGAALADAGVRRGHIVPLVLPNGADFVTHFFGLLAIGATPSVLPLPWALRSGEGYRRQLQAIAAQIRPSHAVVAGKLHDLVRQSLGEQAAGIRLLTAGYADRAADAERAHGEL